MKEMKKMKLAIIPALLLATAVNAKVTGDAQYTVTNSPGVNGGVYSSRIESRELTADEIQGIDPMMATATVSASARSVSTKVHSTVMAYGHHTVCFTTMFTTEADYSFLLNVGGRQTNISQHIVIPAHQMTCISHDTYQSVTFPTRGNYSFTATTSARTQLAGSKSTTATGMIEVR